MPDSLAAQASPVPRPGSAGAWDPGSDALPIAWTAGALVFRSGDPAPWTRPFAIAVPGLAGGLLLWVALAWFFQRRKRSFRDSPEFLRAMETRHPLIPLGAKTPRSVKKFLNRLRFFAVLRRNASEAGELDGVLEDDDLVALASVEPGVRSLCESREITPKSLEEFEAVLRNLRPDSSLVKDVQALVKREDMMALLKAFERLGAHARINA